jgi:hypothetical protein
MRPTPLPVERAASAFMLCSLSAKVEPVSERASVEEKVWECGRLGRSREGDGERDVRFMVAMACDMKLGRREGVPGDVGVGRDGVAVVDPWRLGEAGWAVVGEPTAVLPSSVLEPGRLDTPEV